MDKPITRPGTQSPLQSDKLLRWRLQFAADAGRYVISHLESYGIQKQVEANGK